jgi:hypothetical protein
MLKTVLHHSVLKFHFGIVPGGAASSSGSSHCRCFDSLPLPVLEASWKPTARHAGPVSGGNRSDAEQRAELKMGPGVGNIAVLVSDF